MSIEIPSEIAGVGAFIINTTNPDQEFITIQELATKRTTNKLTGMRSYPMETIEPGEDHDQALRRLFQEEIRIHPLLALPKVKLGEFPILPGILLHTYLFEIGSNTTIAIGSAAKEVRDPRWTKFEEVLKAPLGTFRAGVYETVVEYLVYLQDPANFRIGIYSKLRDQIPDEIFDFMDTGFIKA